MVFWYRQTKNGEWRWRLRGENKRLIAESGEGYINKADCLHAINLIQQGAAAAEVKLNSKPD
jgi:uncharacterized protein